LAGPPFRLPADTSIARVHLEVAALARSLDFYAGTLGMRAESDQARAAVVAAGGETIIELSERPGATHRPQSVLGIYHFAILYPDRPALAHALKRLIEARWPFAGFADHGVSEAAYLADPDGIGIELYVDRPRDAWPRAADGGLEMYTRPLDLEGLLGQAAASGDGAQGGERIGHIHLHVADLARSESFYAQALGFDVMQRGLPGALFLAAGGYHHHVGVNTWARGRASPPDAARLVDFTLTVPDPQARSTLAERLRPASPAADGFSVVDPDGIGVVVVAG